MLSQDKSSRPGIDRRHFIKSVSACVSGVAFAGEEVLAGAALPSAQGVAAAAPAAFSLSALALPLLSRANDFYRTVLAFEQIYFDAGRNDLSSFTKDDWRDQRATSIEDLDFRICDHLYPLISAGQFYFPDLSPYQALAAALLPSAHPALKPTGKLIADHFRYCPDLREKAGDTVFLDAYLNAGENSNAKKQPSKLEIEAWREVSQKSLGLIGEFKECSQCKPLVLTQFKQRDRWSGGLPFDPYVSAVEQLRRSLAIMFFHGERALTAFSKPSYMGDSQCWKYLEVFSNPKLLPEIASDPLFIARGKCAQAYRAWRSLARPFEDYGELPLEAMEKAEQTYLERCAELKKYNIRTPKEWEPHIEEFRHTMRQIRAEREYKFRMREEALEKRREAKFSLPLVNECFPAHWRKTGPDKIVVELGKQKHAGPKLRLTINKWTWRLGVRLSVKSPHYKKGR